MKNFFKGLIVFLVVTMVLVVIPIKMISEFWPIYVDMFTIEGQYETYSQKLEKIVNGPDKDARALAVELSIISDITIGNIKEKGCEIINYFDIILTLLVLIIGIYGLKKWENKKYIAKALIISGIVSILWLAFWYVSLYFTHIK